MTLAFKRFLNILWYFLLKTIFNLEILEEPFYLSVCAPSSPIIKLVLRKLLQKILTWAARINLWKTSLIIICTYQRILKTDFLLTAIKKTSSIKRHLRNHYYINKYLMLTLFDLLDTKRTNQIRYTKRCKMKNIQLVSLNTYWMISQQTVSQNLRCRDLKIYLIIQIWFLNKNSLR